jgi:acetyltransferase-like isoleucine patch superfamily enzyme
MTKNPTLRKLSWRRRFFLWARWKVIAAQIGFYRRVLGMDLGDNVRMSLRAKLDFTYPQGIHIGEGSYVAFGAVIFTHDMSRLYTTDTYVGKNCFIGANAIVMAGVRIGDQCIVGSGSVVTRDVPSGSIVAGNPARVLRSGIRTRAYGILEEAYDATIAEKEKMLAGAET